MTCKLKKIATAVAFLTFAAPNLAISGNEPSMDLTQAAGLVAQKEYTKAIEAYTAILEGDTPSTEDRGSAFFQRGVAEQEIGMTGHAIADFTQAIWLGHLDNKELATAHFRRGKGYSLLKQYSRAITDFDRAIQLEPAFAQAYSERGDAYRNRGIYKLAIQDYSTSIRLLNPDLHVPYFGRGLTHEAMGNQRLADADFRRASELQPEFNVAKAKAAGGVEYKLAAASSTEATGAIAPGQQIVVDDGGVTSDFVAQNDAEALSESTSQTVHATVQPLASEPEVQQRDTSNQVAESVTAPQVVEAPASTTEIAHAETSLPEQNNDSDVALREASEVAKTNSNAVAVPDVTAQVDNTASDRTADATSTKVAELATNPEPTGSIAQSDRDISASDIREEQTALATAKPLPSQLARTQQSASSQENSTSKAPSDKATVTAALPDAGGRFLVQVASYREKDDALARFNKLSGKHSDLLSELSPDILRADLGAKGVYYRLRIGPFESFEKSTDLCNALKARNLDCLVIERKSTG